MKRFMVVIGLAAFAAGCQASDHSSSDDPLGGFGRPDAAPEPAVLENDALMVTFGVDASLTVLVKATSYTWSAPAAGRAYAVADRKVTNRSISATLTRGTSESWSITITLAAGGDNTFEVSVTPTDGRQHVELPGYPYAFTMPTETGNYVQNTASDGLLFPLAESSSIMNMYDFVSIPWWGLTDMTQSMMAILETPYMGADHNLPSIVLAPEKLKYVFLASGSYVDLARYYREYLFSQNPGLREATLAASAKPGIANLKDGAYIYFWEDAAQTASFMTSLYNAGLKHVVALLYYGGTNLTDAEIGSMYTTMEQRGWTGGIYTLPGANYGEVAPGEWARNLTLGTLNPVDFWNDPDTKQNGFDKTCVKQAMLGPEPIVDNYTSLMATAKNQLNYFDTFVIQVAPCLDASHVNHRALTETGPLPASVDEDRDFRMRFLDATHAMGIVGSGEGGSPAWAIPHLDYFEGAMVLGEYGEMHTSIPSGGYADDFATSISDENAGYNTDEKHRIPLFELMFHDHVASTWNWRNTNYQNTETSAKKDLFNALYGTMPMYNMTSKLWTDHSQDFLESYTFTQGTRKLIGFSDMTGFGYLSGDKKVQYTDWDGPGGTRVIANFASTPRQVGTMTIPALGYKLTTHP